MPLTLYLRLVAKQVNSVEATKKLVQMSHLFWHFSEELECWLWTLGKSDGEISSLKLLPLLKVTFIVLLRKLFSMFWLLCKTGKCFLNMVLILDSRGLYCVIKLHEVEHFLLCVLGCLASSLEMFLISEKCFLTFLGLQSLAMK